MKGVIVSTQEHTEAEPTTFVRVLQCDYGSGWEDEKFFPDTDEGKQRAERKLETYQMGAVDGYRVQLIIREAT